MTSAAARLPDESRPSAPPRGGAGALGLLLVALILGGGWLALERDPGPDAYFAPLKAWALLVLCLAPGLRYAWRLRHEPGAVEPVPFLPLLGVVYAVLYALPVLVRDQVAFMRLSPPAELVARALDLALVGWLALLAAFYVVGPRLALGHPLATRWDPDRARRAAVPLIALGVAADLARELAVVPRSLSQVVFLLELLFPIGLGMLLVLALRGRLGLGGKLAVWAVLVPLFVGLRLGQGVIGELVYSGVFLLLVVWSVRRRVPWLAVAPLVVALLLLKASLVDFRQVVWNTNAGSRMGEVERARLAARLVQDNLAHRGLGETLGHVSDQLAARTAAVGVLAHALERTPRFVPYHGGETYETLPATLVPRVLWPGKPTKELGQWFGHRYGLLDPWDDKTSVNLPQLVELYINFGALGVLGGMFVFGLVYRWLQRLVNEPGADDGVLLAGCLLFSRLINLESDWSLVFGTVLQIAVVLWAVMRWVGASPAPFRAGRSRRPASPAVGRSALARLPRA